MLILGTIVVAIILITALLIIILSYHGVIIEYVGNKFKDKPAVLQLLAIVSIIIGLLLARWLLKS